MDLGGTKTRFRKRFKWISFKLIEWKASDNKIKFYYDHEKGTIIILWTFNLIYCQIKVDEFNSNYTIIENVERRIEAATSDY